MEAKKIINPKLKSIYFQWAINYQGPPPRSLADNFFEHLEYEHYDFSEDWFEKALLECVIDSKENFDGQMILIEESYEKYSEQQESKRQKKREKSFNKFCLKCEEEGVLPF